MSTSPSPFGLVDGNNFYCSVERIFDPSLRNVPMLVMSNNDGCAIARSNEAKALGVTMGQPIHQIPSRIRKQLHVRSANFALYGDISARIATILRDLFADVEVYSIDESFVSFKGIRAQDRRKVAAEARARILRWVGVRCCVGIGPTKTLAKMAISRNQCNALFHFELGKNSLACAIHCLPGRKTGQCILYNIEYTEYENEWKKRRSGNDAFGRNGSTANGGRIGPPTQPARAGRRKWRGQEDEDCLRRRQFQWRLERRCRR